MFCIESWMSILFIFILSVVKKKNLDFIKAKNIGFGNTPVSKETNNNFPIQLRGQWTFI